MGRTWVPATAGILNIISGVFLLIGGVAVANQPIRSSLRILPVAVLGRESINITCLGTL